MSPRKESKLKKAKSKKSKVGYITFDDLAKHNSKNDAWIAIRGRVYDITKYILEHPGGQDPLLGKLGKDGTKSFNAVHAYVDAAQILKLCDKGALEGDDTTQSMTTAMSEVSTSTRQGPGDDSDEKNCICCIRLINLIRALFKGKDDLFPKTKFSDNTNMVVYEVKFPKVAMRVDKNDWTVVVEGQTLIIRKFVDPSRVWQACFTLPTTISDDGVFRNLTNDYSVCEVTITKPAATKWSQIGEPSPTSNNKILESSDTQDFCLACVSHKESLTHDVNLYAIRVKKCAFLCLKLGHHIKLQLGEVTRSYTPVCHSLMGGHHPAHCPKEHTLWLIVKTYPDGKLTSPLNQLSVDQSHHPKITKETTKLKVLMPQGTFDRLFIVGRRKLLMFAAGTGVTPMTRILHWIQEHHADEYDKVYLLFWNKTEADIIWKADFEYLQNKENWFFFYPILTQSVKGWKGLTGRPTTEQITTILDNNFDSDSTGVLVCGPQGFTESVQKIVHVMFSPQNVFLFEA